MDGAALRACAFFHIGIECVEQRRQILHNIAHFNFDSVDEFTARETKPFETIPDAGCPGALDNEPDGTGDGALRGVTDVG